jgi:dolichyl-phosphate-mannose--protein O-mannosyl transferase
MKTSTLNLSLQLLTFIPLNLYLFIYTEQNALFFSFFILSIILIIIPNIKNKDFIINITILSMLLLSFYIYSIQELGSKKTPQTYKTYNYKNISTSFKLDTFSKVDEVCYYFFINKDAKFILEYEHKDQWNELLNYKQDFPLSFQWNCQKITPKLVKKLKMTTKDGQMMLAEIRFRCQGKDINFTSEFPRLNDETNIPVSKSYYDGMVFDEIYHGRTAYEIIKNIYPVYENTHPYLGKVLITPGIKLFGMTPFGWRFMSVIFGAIFIIVAYFFALELFKKPLYGLIGAFLMTYSFMHFSESRMAMIDNFGVLFVFISYLFLYRFIIKQKLSWLLLSGLFFGLASAVKWSAVFAALGFLLIGIYLLISKYPLEKKFAGYKLLLYGLLSYGIIAITTYLLTFYDLYLHTGTFQSIIDYQFNMYNYHSNLIASHPYSSPWWSWPFDIKPMCAYRNIVDTQFSSITIFGNPAIFWVGIASIFYLIYRTIKQKELEATFILLAFIGLYTPYIFIGRLMFIYHYYYAVPFLILAIIYGIKDFLTYYPKYSILLWIYLTVVAGLFLAFYPVLSGYEVPKTYVDNFLVWFPGWWL